ncbi:MAG: hypothetical protein IVW54_00450 [Candidatus Binataceae bacterium]|nr:hypothetical protein [Candidatus Binataceae bacterium]
MRRRLSILFAIATITVTTSAFAQVALPASVSVSATVNRPYHQVFGTLKNYFASPDAMTLVSADEKTGTIVAHRNSVETATWNRWAYCKVGAMGLLDNLQSSSADLTIKLTHAGAGSTLVTVTANYHAVYSFASQTDNVACTSTGALEREILTVAGAKLPPAPTPAPSLF